MRRQVPPRRPEPRLPSRDHARQTWRHSPGRASGWIDPGLSTPALPKEAARPGGWRFDQGDGQPAVLKRQRRQQADRPGAEHQRVGPALRRGGGGGHGGRPAARRHFTPGFFALVEWDPADLHRAVQQWSGRRGDGPARISSLGQELLLLPGHRRGVLQPVLDPALAGAADPAAALERDSALFADRHAQEVGLLGHGDGLPVIGQEDDLQGLRLLGHVRHAARISWVKLKLSAKMRSVGRPRAAKPVRRGVDHRRRPAQIGVPGRAGWRNPGATASWTKPVRPAQSAVRDRQHGNVGQLRQVPRQGLQPVVEIRGRGSTGTPPSRAGSPAARRRPPAPPGCT